MMKLLLLFALTLLTFSLADDTTLVDETRATTEADQEAQKTTANPGTTGNSQTASVPVTSAVPCVDDPAAHCSLKTSYCTNPAYRDLMQKECPVTCGFCGSSDCFDATDKCAAWKENGFCTNPFYKDDVDKYCKKTCGDC